MQYHVVRLRLRDETVRLKRFAFMFDTSNAIVMQMGKCNLPVIWQTIVTQRIAMILRTEITT